MYLNINGDKYTVAKRIVAGGTIKYLSVTPAVDNISGLIQMYRDDGFLMATDDADAYERKTHIGTLLELSNDPETVPTAPSLTLEDRVAAIESAITKGLSL